MGEADTPQGFPDERIERAPATVQSIRTRLANTINRVYEGTPLPEFAMLRELTGEIGFECTLGGVKEAIQLLLK